jgi:spore germination protein KC
MLLKSIIARTPNLTHIRAMVFSEELAREGTISSFMTYNIRNRDFREAMFIIIVKGTAEEYIKKNKPSLEANISKFYETMLASANESSYYLLATYHEFYTRVKNAGASPYAVYSGINPMTGEDRPAGGKTSEQKGDPYLPGGMPRNGTGNAPDFLGLAVFRGYKMVGVLNSDETRAVAILQGKFSDSSISVVDPLLPEKDFVNLSAHCDPQPKITADLNGGRPVFDIAVTIEAQLLGTSSGINYESPGYRELLEAQVSKMFKDQIMSMIRHTQELGTDPVGFGLYLRPNFANTSEMEQADMLALYQAADVRVNVTTKIRRTGLLWRITSGNK